MLKCENERMYRYVCCFVDFEVELCGENKKQSMCLSIYKGVEFE